MPSVKLNNNPSKILFTSNKKLPKLANVGFQENKGNRPANLLMSYSPWVWANVS